MAKSLILRRIHSITLSLSNSGLCSGLLNQSLAFFALTLYLYSFYEFLLFSTESFVFELIDLSFDLGSYW